MPPDAKLPTSQRPFMSRHNPGYLTATTEWYVIGLTRELEGNMSPQAWESVTPAVWQLRSAWISPAIVSACCSIQARRISEREKLTVVPSKSLGSTSWGRSATSPDVAVRNWATRPGRIVLSVLRSSAAGWVSWLVHMLPNTCSPLAKMFWTRVSPSLAVSSNSLIMASNKLDGMKYVLLLRRPCFLASKSCRDRLALGAARASPPGVCCASPVQRISGCCLSRLIVAISRSVPYC